MLSEQASGATRKRTAYSKTPPPTLRLEDLPRHAVDTLATRDPETKVVIYSNNTWRYIHTSLARKHSGSPVYRNNWDTTQIFAYKNVEPSSLPSTIELQLIDDLSGFHYPYMKSVISPFGPRGRRGHKHQGVDLPLRIGDPIYATFDGKVRYAKYNSGGYGNLVIVRHANGLETWYAHLTRCNVEPNDWVKAGQVIGFGGSTGRSTGPHLHFEVRYSDLTFDPQFLFDFPNGLLKYQTFPLDRSYLDIHSRASDELIEDDEDFDPEAVVAAASRSGEAGSILEQAALGEQAEAGASASKPAAPKPASTAAKTYYTVRSGDTLGRIAERNKLTLSQLCRLNGMTTKSTIRPGQKLRIK
jgi:murein DD-endopeptidase MepM/ murein hydrolase activator NlpD